MHCWLLYKLGRLKITSPEDPSRLSLFVPVCFKVPKDIQGFKTMANIFYALSIVCLAIFLFSKFDNEGQVSERYGLYTHPQTFTSAVIILVTSN